MSWWRALLEAIAPLPAILLGAAMASPYVLAWHLRDDRWATVVLATAGGVAALLACVGLLRLEGRPASWIGWTPRDLSSNIGIGLAAYILTAIGLVLLFESLVNIFPQINQHENDAARAIKETFPKMSLPVAAMFMLFVAIWEEFVFRGFMLTRLHAVFKRWWLTIPVGAVLFGFGHGYEGGLAMVQTMLLGLILGALFVWRKSLVPGIVFHFLNNFLAFLLLRMAIP
jgi:membrane protease YdiL (CAAX protease family)